MSSVSGARWPMAMGSVALAGTGLGFGPAASVWRTSKTTRTGAPGCMTMIGRAPGAICRPNSDRHRAAMATCCAPGSLSGRASVERAVHGQAPDERQQRAVLGRADVGARTREERVDRSLGRVPGDPRHSRLVERIERVRVGVDACPVRATALVTLSACSSWASPLPVRRRGRRRRGHPRGHALHLLHDERDGVGLLVRRVRVLSE